MATKADPLPMLVAGVGFLLVYAGVKNKDPLAIAKTLAQGKNPSGAPAPAPVSSSQFSYGGGTWGTAMPAPTPPSTPGGWRATP